MAGGAKKKRVARGSKKKKGAVRDVVADLTDDVLVDILSRVPVKSLCLCKSVCRRWRDLISDPDHRKKLPQTLAGFFYGSYDTKRFRTSARHFINVSGAGDPLIDPSLWFLPEYESIDFVDGCNGVLLCRGWKPTNPVTLDYLVCNLGHLYFAARRVADGSNDYGLSVWVLEDYNSENWSLKHNVTILDLFGAHYYSVFRDNFKVISIHPEHNVIFMVCGIDRTLKCYEMDHRRLRFISRLGSQCSTPYIPYVPLFSGSLGDEH